MRVAFETEKIRERATHGENKVGSFLNGATRIINLLNQQRSKFFSPKYETLKWT